MAVRLFTHSNIHEDIAKELVTQFDKFYYGARLFHEYVGQLGDSADLKYEEAKVKETLDQAKEDIKKDFGSTSGTELENKKDAQLKKVVSDINGLKFREHLAPKELTPDAKKVVEANQKYYDALLKQQNVKDFVATLYKLIDKAIKKGV